MDDRILSWSSMALSVSSANGVYRYRRRVPKALRGGLEAAGAINAVC
ncbi:MAG: hypothetical protein ACO20V_13140 [Alphaproteobacteria bacterium]